MKNKETKQKVIKTHPKFLWFLILAFSMGAILANWFEPQIIRIFNLDISAGILLYTATFLLSALITEVYGYKHARCAIWCGFIFNLLLIIYGQAVIYMPNPRYLTDNTVFNTLLTINPIFIYASIFSYFCIQPLNSFLISKLKIRMSGNYLYFRFLLSTSLTVCIDSIAFSLVVFHKLIYSSDLLLMIVSLLIIRFSILMVGLPIFVYLAKKIKQLEKLDIYDWTTNFNPFSFETNYVNMNNELSKENICSQKN